MTSNPLSLSAAEVAAGYSEAQGVTFIYEKNFARFIGHDDFVNALPFPSKNRWLLDEVALWLALGHVDRLNYSDFSSEDILYYRELHAPSLSKGILCHYASRNTDKVADWIRIKQVETRLVRTPAPW
jgi:hypothetical protein